MMLSSEVLKGFHHFAGLSENTLKCIDNASCLMNYGPAETVILEGEPAEAAFFVLQGEVKVYRMTRSGKEQVLARMKAGQSFNTIPLLGEDGLNHSSAETLSEAALLRIMKKDFLALLKKCPDFSYAMLRDFSARLRRMTDMVESFALHSVRGRLAAFLIRQADLGRQASRYTRDDIAREIGTVRDVVGRLLKSFEQEGYIRRDGRRVVLLDRAGLETEADS
jgi:CRP/FNR family transcriptional regulator